MYYDGLFTTNKRQMNVDRIFDIVVLRLKHVFLGRAHVFSFYKEVLG